MKILIFTEGTAIMHSAAEGVNREERVKQSAEEIEGVYSFRSYRPNGDVVQKLNNWKSQGAEIYYLTSRVKTSEVDDILFVLKNNGFPDTKNLLFQKEGQNYKDVVEKLMPDIFIEDNCESIGGEVEMTYPHVNTRLKGKIHSIVSLEFAGIDHLPDDVLKLKLV